MDMTNKDATSTTEEEIELIVKKEVSQADLDKTVVRISNRIVDAINSQACQFTCSEVKYVHQYLLEEILKKLLPLV